MDDKYKGKIYERLTVVSSSIEKDKNGKSITYCDCECSCGKFLKHISISQLNRGKTKSCGCLMIELASKRFKKYNEYDLSGNMGIGYDTNNKEFFFDLEDYDKLKDYRWYIEDGYATCKVKNKRIKMHNLVMGLDENNGTVDHENRIRHDNRKENLRFCTKTQNVINHSIMKNSKTGIIGITLRKNRYYGTIGINGKSISLGSSEDIDEIICKRLTAEKKYFGDFSPQKHLFKKYGIS